MREVNRAPINRELLAVKEYLPGMIDECTDLFLKVFTKEPWNDKWDTREDAKKYLESHVLFNSFVGFVAVFKNRIVGVSLGFIKPWQEGFEYYINEYYVDNEMQRSGIGSVLLEEIKVQIKSKNMNAIILATEKAYPAYNFYVKNGFKEFGGMAFLAIRV